MAPFDKRQKFLTAVGAILALCGLLIACCSGFSFETNKLKTMILSAFMVVLLVFFVGDLIYFLLKSLWLALHRETKGGQEQDVEALIQTQDDQEPKFNRGDFLRVKLSGLKFRCLVPKKHQKEESNVEYAEIARELWLFARFFCLLLLLVVCSRNSLLYYNTHIVTSILMAPLMVESDTPQVRTIWDVYAYVENTLIESFNENNDSETRNSGWLRFQTSRLLDVVRLRQVRCAKRSSLGQLQPVYTQEPFMPGWKLPYTKFPYEDKYWRTYGPFLPYTDDSFYSLVLSRSYSGALHTYPGDTGYVTLLARDYNDSRKIIEYIRKYNWLGRRTAGLFIDFTLFTVDSHIFSVCNVLLEQTPFGGVVSKATVESSQLLLGLEHLSIWVLFIWLLYILQLIQFTLVFVLKIKSNPKLLLGVWNILDALIIVLNLLIFWLLYRREYIVKQLLKEVGSLPKQQFIDFRLPAQLDYLSMVLGGFLVCFATLRIWKILQVNDLFRTFTRTLRIAKWALLSGTLIIALLLFSFALSACLINGANSIYFLNAIRSLTSALVFAFSNANGLETKELNYGGELLGFILYGLLMLVVVVLLTDMFITIIMDYHTRAKRETMDQDDANKLSFLEFLAMEHSWVCQCLHHRRCNRKPKQFTVYERMQRKMDRLEQKQAEDEEQEALKPLEKRMEEREQGEGGQKMDGTDKNPTKNKQAQQQQQKERLNRLHQLAEILLTQMELLQRDLIVLNIELDSDDEEQTPRLRSKNGWSNLGPPSGHTMNIKKLFYFLLS